MAIQITTLEKTPELKKQISEALDIFYESSTKKTFTSEEEKKKFEYKYFGWYLERPETFLIALESNPGNESVKVIGYLAGSIDTPESYFALHPWLETFRNTIERFPAHLHINLHADARGKGIGSLLIKAFEHELQSHRIHGVHLITDAKARNVSFYLKNAYIEAQFHDMGSIRQLMLAKKLT